MRTRTIYDDNGEILAEFKDGELVRGMYYTEPETHFVRGEIEGYESPASGEWIDSRRKRREDFKRTGTREWEGAETERKLAKQWEAENAKKMDAKIERGIHHVLNNLPERTRRVLLASQ